MAQLPKDERHDIGHLGHPECTQDRDEPLLRRSELSQVLAPRVRQVDERIRHDAQVAVAAAERLLNALDRVSRRIIGNEVPHELGRDEPRGRGMPA